MSSICSRAHTGARPWAAPQRRWPGGGLRRPMPGARARLPAALPPDLAASLDFSKVKTETQFLGALSGAAKAGILPESVARVWEDFYMNYKRAVLGSGLPEATEELVVEVQASIAERVLVDMREPFTFESYHERLLEPYNYYEFGQKYVGTLIDFKNSVVGHLDRWDRIRDHVEAGHNVVLLANHQTEADPAVFAHMLASTHPSLGENVIYIAGDRVVTDAMCKPFSMGRNLFCVHSKKHMDDIPELKQEKMAMNRRTLAVMARKMNAGGLLMWIAPSGGRDRPDDADQWRPAPFDPTAVELFRKLVKGSKAEGHLYPMAMLSWGVMPPPKKTEKAVGERRMTTFAGVGLSVCEELDVEGIEGEGEGDGGNGSQAELAKAAEALVAEEYKRLEAAVNDPVARADMTQYEQPWLRAPLKV